MTERLARLQGSLLDVAQHRIGLGPSAPGHDQRHGLARAGELLGGTHPQGVAREPLNLVLGEASPAGHRTDDSGHSAVMQGFDNTFSAGFI